MNVPEVPSDAADLAEVAPPHAPTPDDAGPRWHLLRRWWIDLCAMAGLLALVPLAVDLKVYSNPPYWLDEAWVAVSTRVPLSDLPLVTASTPLGWTLLLRLIPGQNHLRLLTLGWLLVAILAAYLVGRAVDWRRRGQAVLAGLACGVAVLTLPVMQPLHDLKQYTADAAIALSLLALTSWAEARLSWRRVGVVGGFGVAGMLFSHSAAPVAITMLVALTVVVLARRRWRELAAIMAVDLLAAAGMAAVYFGVDARGNTAGLEAYWHAYFPAPHALLGYLANRTVRLPGYIGLPWGLYLLLLVAGSVVLALHRRPAGALTVLLLPLLMIGLGVGHLYPLLDRRTSTFLFAFTAAVAALAVTGAAIAAADVALRRGRPDGSVHGRLTAFVAGALIVALVGGYVLRNDDRLHNHAAHRENIRAQVNYLVKHRQIGDVVVVNEAAGYGFAFYWRADNPVVVPQSNQGIGFQLEYPDSTGIVIANGITTAAVAGALAHARRLAAANGPATRIWVVLSHASTPERAIWLAPTATANLTEIKLKPDSLYLMTVVPSPAG